MVQVVFQGEVIQLAVIWHVAGQALSLSDEKGLESLQWVRQFRRKDMELGGPANGRCDWK